MTRNITDGFKAEIESKHIVPIVLVKAEFDSGDLNLWTGYGDIVYNGDTYTGGGELLGISSVNENQRIEADNINISLTGIDASLISIALAEHYYGRPITVYFGLLQQTEHSRFLVTEDGKYLTTEDGVRFIADYVAGQIVDDPIVIFGGQLDTMKLAKDGKTATITANCENDLIKLTRPKVRRYTDEDQKLDYPDDNFFKQVNSLQEAQITWGKDVK